LNKNLGIQGELVYIERNSSGIFPIPTQVPTGEVVNGTPVTVTELFDLDVQMELKYLELPIMARYDFNPGGFFRPYIMAGPYIGFNLSSKNVYLTEESGRIESDYDDIKTLTFGLYAGAGLGIKLGPDELLFEARYSMALSKISDIFDGKPRGFSLMVGYAFL
jgi:opacity protein-like surface antigen